MIQDFNGFQKMLNENIEQDFDKVVKVLSDKKIPCRVKLVDNQITVECGFDYPDSLFDKIMDAVEPMKINVDVVAETSGGKLIKTERIAGGPKRY